MDSEKMTKTTNNVELDYTFKPAEDVEPLELVGNASLALHHHMAPADGVLDLDSDDAE